MFQVVLNSFYGMSKKKRNAKLIVNLLIRNVNNSAIVCPCLTHCLAFGA